MSKPAQLTVDIVSDVVCPWCAIGYRQLERAVGMMGDRAEISVRWHPFELAPNMPAGGQSIADYVHDRYGVSPEQSGSSRRRITETGAAIGLEFNYSPESRMYNTRRAHQLLAWAGEEGRQTALKLGLFKAFFTDQRDVSDAAVLLDIAEAAGLDRNAASIALDDPKYAQQVEAEEAYWVDQNVTGVPAFVINGKYMVPGAQEAETFVQVFEKIIAKEAAQ